MNDGFDLAPWSGGDDRIYTLREAAALCVPFPPGYSFPRERDQTDSHRRMIAQRDGWLKVLSAGVSDGSLPAAMGHAMVTRQRRVSMPHDDGWRVGGGSYLQNYQAKVESVAESTVTRAELCRWLRSQGHSPAFFSTAEQSASASSPGEPELNTRSRRTALAIMAALAKLGELDLTNLHGKGGLGEVLSEKIEALFGLKLSTRTVADYLADARDLPHEDCK